MLNQAILKRQPIVGADRKILGNRLGGGATPEETGGLAFNALALATELWPAPGHLVFIPVAPAQLEALHDNEALPAKNIVLLLQAPLDDATRALCRSLRAKRGFQIAVEVNDTTCGDQGLNHLAGWLSVDAPVLGEEGMARVGVRSNRPSNQLLAHGVQTHDLFRASRRAGCGRIEGNWFTQPQQWAGKPVVPAHNVVVELLDRIRKEAPDTALEEVFKRDVTLTFKLLRFINTAGFGLSCEIESIWHAIRVVGRRELYRWLTLLLVTTDEAAPQVLTRTAVVRGRFCELLGGSLLDKQELDSLFITGVFSLLDAMLEVPMDKALENLILPDAINEALLARSGLYAPFLALAIACEDLQPGAEAATLAHSLGLSPLQVNQAHLAALAWADTLGL